MICKNVGHCQRLNTTGNETKGLISPPPTNWPAIYSESLGNMHKHVENWKPTIALFFIFLPLNVGHMFFLGKTFFEFDCYILLWRFRKVKKIRFFIIKKCIKNVFKDIFSSKCHLINFFKAVFLLNVETLT